MFYKMNYYRNIITGVKIENIKYFRKKIKGLLNLQHKLINKRS